MSRGGGDDGKTDQFKSQTDPHGIGPDPDEKFHKEYLIFLDDARRTTKAMKDEYEKVKAAELEKLQKKKR